RAHQPPSGRLAPALHRHPRRLRRRHHSQPGPDIAVRDGDPDVHLLRGLDPDREAPRAVSEPKASEPMSRAPARDAFLAALGFELDPFQVRALDALDAGRSVLVAAPTGSGKTVVAEYAVAKALDEGRKAFYTTPLKALSNQKFGDLSRRHGP